MYPSGLCVAETSDRNCCTCTVCSFISAASMASGMLSSAVVSARRSAWLRLWRIIKALSSIRKKMEPKPSQSRVATFNCMVRLPQKHEVEWPAASADKSITQL
ncbi:hypothetical protein KM92DES2_10004 [uncultured Desulfovibrio sp.]|uniref:Uncharacterized protein n=1 Tax=uncultured Desulfovibrio sp. TaxID=167968 RepID=A0A212ITG9_9BACT|nr:hypothetical protein KM92DES2_10004 [uncultured Desulfovibrio sp.]